MTRLKLTIAALTAILAIGTAASLAPAANAATASYITIPWITPYKVITTTAYKLASSTRCHNLLKLAPSRSTNPIGCRYKEVRRRTYYSDAVTGWTWATSQITFWGPFGFWAATSAVTYHYNGSSIWIDSQRCPLQSAFVKIDYQGQGCHNWKTNGDLVHAVDFKTTYDPIPFVFLTYGYWAEQRINPAGNAWANSFGP